MSVCPSYKYYFGLVSGLILFQSAFVAPTVFKYSEEFRVFYANIRNIQAKPYAVW